MDSERIEELAAQWLLRRHGEHWTAAQQSELDSWLAQSTAHLVSYLRLEAALQQVDRLQALRVGDAQGRVPPRGSLIGGVTATESGTTRSEARGRWRAVLAVAAVLTVLVFGSLYLMTMHNGGEQQYATRVGDLRELRLADGSLVTLNTDTRIRVFFGGTERSVDLDSGEAFFVVAKNPARPFVVHVAGKQVIAVGTALSVRLSPNADIQVLVTEGRVRLRRSGGSASDEVTMLDAGTVARTHNNEIFVQTASEDDTERMLSWRKGFVVFHDTPLADAIAEFNRYTRKKLVIADDSIAAIRISGKFRCSNVEAFLALLQQGFPVTVEESEDRIVLKRRK